MPRVLRDSLLSARDLLATIGPFFVLAALLLVGAYFMLDPNPPRHVILATGPENSDYAEFGKRYAEELKRHGIQVELKPTAGSAANLRMLRDEAQAVDLAFVQGGSSDSLSRIEEDKRGLPMVSLGSLFPEPVWIFYRVKAAQRLNKEATLTQLAQLQGWRVNVGGRGAGVSGILNRLLAANTIDRDSLERTRLEQTPAVMAFLADELDAVVFASAPESPLVHMLLMTPGVKLFEFPQAEAYSRKIRYLNPVVLPRGIADIARDMPPRDVPLVSPTCSLVAREGTHPALVQLFVQAAHKIHGGSSWFARAGQFPTAQSADLPLAKEAERYYRNGPPLLQRYLPFWLANLIDRMWVALFSIAALLIPLARVVPPLYEFRIRSRVFRWYLNLRHIEDALNRKSTPPAELLEQLNRLDAKAELTKVPLSYADQLYSLRSHIQLVRERLQQS
jgi:TRAP-type uncharacterized transport system substrate-binding protein